MIFLNATTDASNDKAEKESLSLSPDYIRDKQRKDSVISEIISRMDRSSEQSAWSDIAMCYVDVQNLWSN